MGGLAQLVERLLCKQKVVGSSPTTSTKVLGDVAQLVEHLHGMQRVPGSSPGFSIWAVMYQGRRMSFATTLWSVRFRHGPPNGILPAMSSSARKSQFLGMSYGTAMHRLRASIMFSLVRQMGLNICHVCDEEILEPDLSIEHIMPWEGRDQQLFWDLSNITFSHRKCNRPHVYTGAKNAEKQRRVTDDPQTSYCAKCDELKDHRHFFSNKSRWNGVSSYCKPCHRSHGYSKTENRSEVAQR